MGTTNFISTIRLKKATRIQSDTSLREKKRANRQRYRSPSQDLRGPSETCEKWSPESPIDAYIARDPRTSQYTREEREKAPQQPQEQHRTI